MTRRRD